MSKANANNAAITPEMIAAFMAKQAADAAATAPKTTAKPAKADRLTTLQALGATMLNHVCTVTKGVEHDGEDLNVFFVSAGRNAVAASKGVREVKFKKPIARVEFKDGTIGFMALENLTVKAPMKPADIARLAAAQKAENDEVLFVVGTCLRQGDKSAQIIANGWLRPIWFPVGDVKAMDKTVGTKMIYEVPAWKIKSEAGADSYEVAKAKQPEIEALLNAK